MKKSYLKRLVLNRETLLELDRIGLEGVAGGVTVKFCDFSGRDTCTTCQLTCTTNFC